MQLQGVRIEYFINGGIAIIWVYPLLEIFVKAFGLIDLPILTEAHFIILIPLCYVTGMFVAFLAKTLFKKKRNKLRKEMFSSHFTDEKIKQIRILIMAAKFNKEVYDLLEVNLTRQRITRGNLINLIITILVFPSYLIFVKSIIWWNAVFPFMLLSALLLLNWKMWVSQQKIYYDYLCETYKLIQKEIK